MNARGAWCMLACAVLVSTGIAHAAGVQAGQRAAVKRGATVREYTKVIPTYPFSDPNPVPVVGRIYPYFRFDGYSDRPIQKRWKVIELENAFIRLTVLPEIGGKIWDAVEKSTGRSFIYNNHVVKFRDIAMRGPWTSGGIEPNYGIIGHTPNCATPVDYVVRRHQDGSVSAVIGVLDLLTRTPWRLEIRLERDKACFTTRSFWFNATPVEQPYYSWMNTGIKAAGNLELVYPGTLHLGHEGEVAPWPMDAGRGKNLSFYEQNDFGPYKSYHVFGQYADFFGAYWHDDDFGMGRYSRRDDKLGKKAWIWGLSRQGMIWDKLLTDSDGQYVEVQSGRLFNQAAEGSTLTPFKHRGFAPYSADTWTEYWFPIKGLGGFVQASDAAALNVVRSGGRLTLRLLPFEPIRETLEVFDGESKVLSVPVALETMTRWNQTLDRDIPADRLRVRLGHRLDFRPAASLALSRPVKAPADFDWDSVFGLYVKGKEWARQREYGKAQEALEACVRKDANYLPALTELAMLRYMALDDDAAWTYVRRALSIDTYDPGANYYYGLVALRRGRLMDARDGFDVAASSPEYRVAAWTELAKIAFRDGDYQGAEAYAVRSLDFNQMNMEAWQLRALVARVRRDPSASRLLTRIRTIDPLSHFADFESAMSGPAKSGLAAFVDGIRNEMPHETLLEMAAWYEGLGRTTDAIALLEQAPGHAEALYWRAFLEARLGRATARDTLHEAEQASPRLVLPFRSESAPVFAWAIQQGNAWQPRYYLALIKWSRNDLSGARALLADCGERPDFAPFFAARSKAFDSVDREGALRDLQHAARLDPREWRYGKLLAERFLEDHAYEKAHEVATRYAADRPDSYILGLLKARTLVVTGHYRDAIDVLKAQQVLPYEGSTDGRALYREAHLLLAAEEVRAAHGEAALALVAAAREWPENLGAGKPYPENVDERLEDWAQARTLLSLGKGTEAGRLFTRLTVAPPSSGPARLLAALALKAGGQADAAVRTASEWAAGERDQRVADWGRRVVAGETATLPGDATTTPELRILAEWMK